MLVMTLLKGNVQSTNKLITSLIFSEMQIKNHIMIDKINFF